jgi:hypothetical protein
MIILKLIPATVLYILFSISALSQSESQKTFAFQPADCKNPDTKNL